MSLFFTGYDRPPTTRSNLQVPANSPGFNFGFNDFTIEWWQLLQKDYPIVVDNTNPYPRVFMSGYADGIVNLGVSFENQCLVYWENSYDDLYEYRFSLPSANILNRWVHISINRIKYSFNSYCTTRIFVNGIELGYIHTRQSIRFNNYPLTIGNQSENILSNYAFQGYITSFLILNGKCLREVPFTPPLQPYLPDKYTVLLLLGTENGNVVNGGIDNADFFGAAAPFVDSPYYTINDPSPIRNSNVDHRNILPSGFNPSIPNPPVDPNIEIARVKKSTLFSGQHYSTVLRQRNYDTTKVAVPNSWPAGYYIKNETENNSRNAALRRARAGGANVPKKVTKVLINQQVFSN